MDCWDYYCYYPWPVEVTVQSSSAGIWTWLTPLLLFGGSLLASGVAFFGIRASNATNRMAIDAADTRAVDDRTEQRDRDFRTWQRDTLLRISSDAIEVALTAQDDYNRLAFGPQMTMESADTIEQAARKIGVYGLQLRLIGAHEAADRCRDIRSTIASRPILEVLLSFNRIYRRSKESPEDNEVSEEELVAWRAQLDNALETFNNVRAALGETIEQELRALSRPDSARPDDQTPAGSTH